LSHAAQHAGFSLIAALLARLKRSKKTRNCCLFKDCIVLTPHQHSCFVALKPKQTVTFVYHCPSIEVHFFPALLFRMVMVKNLLSDLSKLADGYLRNSHLIFSLVFLEEVVLVALVVVKVIVLFGAVEA